MKKMTFIAGLMALCAPAFAQNDVQSAAAAAAAAISEAPKAETVVEKPQYWKNSVEFSLGFNQTGLTNWAAGGYNTLTLSTGIDAKANYSKGLMNWNNRLQLDYGFLWSADKDNLLQKSNDRIYLESQWAYKTSDKSKWNYTALFSFRSQFTDSYDSYKLNEQTSKWEGTLKSGPLSPAYTNIALGMEWKPANWFDLNFAPVTGGFTIVTNPELRQKYGMQLKGADLDAKLGDNYRSALFQFGAQLKANAKLSINDVFTYETQLVLFTDYLNKPFKDVRINWDNKISWTAAKFFKVAFSTWLIYDPIVMIDDVFSKTQFKEFFTISFIYSISNNKK